MASRPKVVGSSRPWGDPPRAVLFDFGGTLDADGIPWKDRFYPLYVAEHMDMGRDRYDQAFYAADDALAARRLKDPSFREILLLQVTGVLEGLSVRDPQLAARLRDRFLTDALHKIRTNARLLERLSRRFRLGIVSNFYGNLERVCLDTGLAPFMSVVVDSACVGFTKPDPRIFEAALARLHTDPEEAVFVGDSLHRDMEGAKRLGMRHIWLVPDASASPVPCCPGDLMIRSLTDLQEVLL